MYCAFNGISSFSASSTERTLAMACTVVQTPQKRSVKSHASRGSRPRRIFSMPRHMVQEAHALLTALLSTSTSMRRCPSIRVIGSMVIRFAIGVLLFEICRLFVFAEMSVLEISGPPDVRTTEPEVVRHVVPVAQGRRKNGESFHCNQKAQNSKGNKAQ